MRIDKDTKVGRMDLVNAVADNFFTVFEDDGFQDLLQIHMASLPGMPDIGGTISEPLIEVMDAIAEFEEKTIHDLFPFIVKEIAGRWANLHDETLRNLDRRIADIPI